MGSVLGGLLGSSGGEAASSLGSSLGSEAASTAGSSLGSAAAGSTLSSPAISATNFSAPSTSPVTTDMEKFDAPAESGSSFNIDKLKSFKPSGGGGSYQPASITSTPSPTQSVANSGSSNYQSLMDYLTKMGQK